MLIIQQIREAIGWLITEALMVSLGVVLVVAMPIFLFVLPLILITLNPNDDFGWLYQTFVYATPLSVMFYMGVLCHYHSLRKWAREGKVGGATAWRKSQGGWGATLTKSFGFMALGFFGSFVCEALLKFSFQYIPHPASGWLHWAIWFAAFPFAAFAPCIFVILKRWNYDKQMKYPQRYWSEKRRLASPDLYTSPELEALEARLIAQGRAARANGIF